MLGNHHNMDWIKRSGVMKSENVVRFENFLDRLISAECLFAVKVVHNRKLSHAAIQTSGQRRRLRKPTLTIRLTLARRGAITVVFRSIFTGGNYFLVRANLLGTTSLKAALFAD